jgi:hypothetical protein
VLTTGQPVPPTTSRDLRRVATSTNTDQEDCSPRHVEQTAQPDWIVLRRHILVLGSELARCCVGNDLEVNGTFRRRHRQRHRSLRGSQATRRPDRRRGLGDRPKQRPLVQSLVRDAFPVGDAVGKDHQWLAIHLCLGNPVDRARRPRPASGQTHPRTARQLSENPRHDRRPCFGVREHELEAFREGRVDQLEVAAAAGNAEDDGRATLPEGAHDRLGYALA